MTAPSAHRWGVVEEFERLFEEINGRPVGERADLETKLVNELARFRSRAFNGGEACARCGRDGCDDPAHRGRDAAAAGLEFLTMRELAARVAAAGPRRWLLRGVWPAGDYGVHAAEMKAQKTWTTVDLAVSIAAGVPWLGYVPVDDPGPVLMFCGEGGAANILRRIRAVAEARGLVAEELAIVVCPRAPHLNDGAHVALMAQQIDAQRPRLIVVDPLYLSARGAMSSDLIGMGALLETVQELAQRVGASLWIVTHHNRKEGRGASRITGAGPAEWGRVLISATVIARHTDTETKATTVLTELDVIGGEIPDQRLRVTRRIWSDDPADLDSPLHLETNVTETEEEASMVDATNSLPPAARKLLEALQACQSGTSTTLVDWIAAKHGHGLKRETTSRMLNELERRGLAVAVDQGNFKAKIWRPVDAGNGDPDAPA